MTVQSTLGLDSLVTKLASVDKGSRKMCRLNVLNQTTPVKFNLLTKLAAECYFAFVSIFRLLHKVWKISRVALLRNKNSLALALHSSIITLEKILAAGKLRKSDFFFITET